MDIPKFLGYIATSPTAGIRRVHLVLAAAALVFGGLFVDQVTERHSWILVVTVLTAVLLSKDYESFQQLPAEPTQSELDQLRAEADELRSQLSNADGFLKRLTSSIDLDFKESVKITHKIPRNGLESTSREATLVAEPGAAIHWRKVALASNTGRPAMITAAKRDGEDMDYYVLDEGSDRVNVICRIDPPLTTLGTATAGASTKWVLEYEREGTWDRLRDHGHDESYFSNEKECPEATMEFHLDGWVDDPTVTKLEPNIGTCDVGRSNRVSVISWTIPNPQTSLKHSIHFKCEE